jgi:hypothetical protein
MREKREEEREKRGERNHLAGGEAGGNRDQASTVFCFPRCNTLSSSSVASSRAVSCYRERRTLTKICMVKALFVFLLERGFRC